MIIKNNDERLIVIGEFRLLPGCNDVDTVLWNQYKIDYSFENMLENKQLEEIFETRKKGEEVIEKEFKDFDFKKKEDILKNTFNIKTLEKWYIVEPDTTIRNRIDEQIKGIKNNTIKQEYGKPKNHT